MINISSSFQEFLESEAALSSNPSSINGEEFKDDLDLLSPAVLPVTKFFPAKLEIMEGKKEEINGKWREVSIQMRVFTVNHLKLINRKARYPTVSEKVETLLHNLLTLYEQLYDLIADKEGEEINAAQEECTQREGEIQDFLSNLEERYYELEVEAAGAGDAPVPAADNSVTGLEQAMKEQLEDSRRREEEEKQARRDKERVAMERTKAKFRAKSEGLKEEAEFVSGLATKVPLGTWKDVEDTKVKQSMRELKDWQDKVEKLRQKRTDLIAQMAEAGIIADDLPGWTNTRLAVNEAANSVQEVGDELKTEDAKRELHSNATSVTEKVQYPSFEGKDEECFADFKVKLEKAFKHNQTVKSAKATKIKENLKGSAKDHIPDSMEDIDDIYRALDRAFGDPTRLLHFKIKSLSKLGVIPSYNSKAGPKAVVDWHLKLETQLQSLLDLGKANSGDEDLTAVIYSLDIIRTVANMFEKHEGETVLAAVFDKRGQVRLQVLKDKISERRASAQEWQHIKEFAEPLVQFPKR